MNLIPKIAKILGMELDEEFKVITPANIEKRCRFHEAGNGVIYLEKYSEAYGQWTQENTDEIGRMVVGSYKVEKLPFEPKDGEEYWSVVFSPFSINRKELKVESFIWQESYITHYESKFCGNVFRTKAEAEREKNNVYKRLTGKEWGE